MARQLLSLQPHSDDRAAKSGSEQQGSRAGSLLNVAAFGYGQTISISLPQ